jgi:nitrite reductase (NADH) large subunit
VGGLRRRGGRRQRAQGRTYGYLERVGLDAVQRAVLDPARQAELLERFAIAKAACDPDPWLERAAPLHPKQFAELDSEPDALDLVAVAERSG